MKLDLLPSKLELSTDQNFSLNQTGQLQKAQKGKEREDEEERKLRKVQKKKRSKKHKQNEESEESTSDDGQDEPQYDDITYEEILRKNERPRKHFQMISIKRNLKKICFCLTFYEYF